MASDLIRKGINSIIDEEEEQSPIQTQNESGSAPSHEGNIGKNQNDDSFGGTMENSYSGEPSGVAGL